jgi:DNA-binding CsgD family transcriptional regulator
MASGSSSAATGYSPPGTITAMIADPTSTLTPRQVELLAMYASGYSLQQIADIKFLSYVTVQKEMAKAKERSQADTLPHLVAVCVQTGVIIKNGRGFKPVQEERVVGE